MFGIQGIDSDIEEIVKPTDNLNGLISDLLDDSVDFPLADETDIPTIPEEASEELRLEEEADALEAALAGTGKKDKITTK